MPKQICVTVIIVSLALLNQRTWAEEAAPVSALRAAPSVPVSLEQESPSSAVKSWWRIMDLANMEFSQKCPDISANLSVSKHVESLYVTLTSGIASKVLAEPVVVCHEEHRTFRREIDEVKAESQTKATVFARIWPTTPIPGTVKLGELETQWRTQGTRYKYALEKRGSIWQIVQIYQFDQYNGSGADNWKPVFERRRPRFHTSVQGVQ